jgi:hypothetical protein
VLPACGRRYLRFCGGSNCSVHGAGPNIGGSEVRSIFFASPSSELLNPNHTRHLRVFSRIQGSLRNAEANFGFGTRGTSPLVMRGRAAAMAPPVSGPGMPSPLYCERASVPCSSSPDWLAGDAARNFSRVTLGVERFWGSERFDRKCEHIADTARSLDHVRCAWIGFQLAPQP